MITDIDEMQGGIVLGSRPQPEDAPEVNTMDVIKASFRTENTIGSILSDEAPMTRPNQEYDPFNDIQGYEIHANNFINADSPETVMKIKSQIDREKEDRKLIEESGSIGFMSSLAAGFVDPVNLVPVGGAATKAYTMGGSILKAAGATAIAGLAGSTASETILSSTQETRTLGESALNIAGATVLSGVLGGAAGLLGRDGIMAAGKRFEDDMVIPRPNERDISEPNSIRIESVGAAKVNDTTIAQETLSKAWGVEKVAAAMKLSPKIRLAVSPSVESRRYIQQLADTPFYYDKNSEGIANPVSIESLIGLQEARIGTAVEQQKVLYKEYRKRVAVEGQKPLSYLTFREEASRATRRDDMHEIAEVQKLAGIYRKDVLDPMKEAAISSKLLPEDVKVKTASSYLHRWWDKQKVAAKRGELKEIIHNGLRTLPEIQTKDGISLADDELAQIADDIIDNLLGHADARLPYDVPLAARGPLKERTLNFIKDIDVEQFLVNDIEAIAKKYVRTMAADVAIKDNFGDMNIVGGEGLITSKIREDYKRLISEAKTDAERLKLESQMKNDLEDIEAIVGQLRGTYGQPDNPDSTIVRVGRSVRELQYMSKLGGMTLSAFTDVARPIMVHGFGRTFGDALLPLIRDFKTFKLLAKEVKESGAAWDMVVDSRTMSLAELTDPYVKGTKFEKGLTALSSGFGKITLMTQWNTALKQFSGVVTQGRIIAGVRSGDGIKPKDARYLAMIGIDADMAKRIAGQLDKYGDTFKGTEVANAAKWKDLEAQRVFRAAIRKEVNRIIVEPGVGDLPLWMKDSEVGKMVGQFKSFSFASTNKVLISGLQEADAQKLSGWMLAVSMGMASYAFKTWDRGEELSDDPRVWIQEGIDRSGLLAIFGEVNQISNKFTRGAVSLQALAGAPPLTRYASANAPGVLFGPTIGTVTDIAQITGSAANGEWTTSDSRALRRMLPYQNLMIARQLFDKFEEGINETMGVR